MSVSVRVWSDFVCPWCYIGLNELNKLKSDYDLDISWQPYFLRPETPPEGLPLPEYIRAKLADPNNPLKLRAEKEGLKMIHREIIPSTRRAHEAAEFARDRGAINAMHASLLRRYWSESEDLWSVQTLRAAAQEAQLNPDDLQEAIETGRYTEVVAQLVCEAQEMGVSAVPTFLLGDKFVIQGAQSQDVFREALKRLGAEPRQ